MEWVNEYLKKLISALLWSLFIIAILIGLFFILCVFGLSAEYSAWYLLLFLLIPIFIPLYIMLFNFVYDKTDDLCSSYFEFIWEKIKELKEQEARVDDEIADD